MTKEQAINYASSLWLTRRGEPCRVTIEAGSLTYRGHDYCTCGYSVYQKNNDAVPFTGENIHLLGKGREREAEDKLIERLISRAERFGSEAVARCFV